MAALPQLPAVQETSDDASKGAVFENILETLQSNNSLLGEIDENTESDETASVKRKRRVKEENTDKKGMFSSALGGLGAGIKGVGGVLNKANPFQEGGLGTKMSILLISGVLFAISKFGDKLVKPLADVLKMIDSEGGILDKLKDTAFFKNAIVAFDKFKERAKLIGEDIEKLLAAAVRVSTFITNAVNSINAYIMSFDTQKEGEEGYGELDAAERAKLFEDVKNKIVDSVGGYVASVVGGMMAYHFGPALLGLAATAFFNARIVAAIKGVAPAAAAPIAGSPFMTKAVVAKLGIAGIVAAGIIGIYSASKNAFANAAVDEQGKIKKESFAGFFIAGGDGEGGVKNSVENAIRVSAIGGALGVGLKFATAGAVGGPMGILAGGLLGMAVGALIGATAGAVGADKMTSVIESVTSTIGGAIDEVATFFGGVVAGIESFIAGDSYEAGKDAYIAKNADPKEVREQKLQALEEAVEREQIAYDNRDKNLPGRNKDAKLNIAKSNLRTFQIKNDLIEETIKKVEKVDLTKAAASASELPGLYTALEGMDSGEFSMNRFGNEYERTLKKIKDIESSIPAYMLSDFKVGLNDQGFYTGANTSAKVIKELTSTVNAPMAERAEVVVMPKLIDNTEIKTFNSNYSSSLGSNNNYSTVRVLGLDGVF